MCAHNQSESDWQCNLIYKPMYSRQRRERKRKLSFFPQVLILMTFTLTVPEAAATPDTIQFKLVTDGNVINL